MRGSPTGPRGPPPPSFFFLSDGGVILNQLPLWDSNQDYPSNHHRVRESARERKNPDSW